MTPFFRFSDFIRFLQNKSGFSKYSALLLFKYWDSSRYARKISQLWRLLVGLKDKVSEKYARNFYYDKCLCEPHKTLFTFLTWICASLLQILIQWSIIVMHIMILTKASIGSQCNDKSFAYLQWIFIHKSLGSKHSMCKFSCVFKHSRALRNWCCCAVDVPRPPSTEFELTLHSTTHSRLQLKKCNQPTQKCDALMR